MKILIFNFKCDAERIEINTLKMRGVAVLTATTGEEAWKQLETHGSSLDLAVVHREGNGAKDQPGLTFIEKVKKDPHQADLPIILTSQVWVDSDFAKHQRTPMGVNGYLSVPFREDQLVSMVEAVLGEKLSEETATRAFTSATESVPLKLPTFVTRAEAGNEPLQLEEVSNIFRSELGNPKATSIHLEGPSSGTGGTFVPKERPKDFTLISSQSLSRPSEKGAEGIDIAVDPEQATRISDAAELRKSTVERGTGVGLKTAQLQSEDFPSIEMEPLDSNGSQADVDTADIPIAAEEHSQASIFNRKASDEALAAELPYLFDSRPGSDENARLMADTIFAVAPPLGDALVPGGAAQAPDIEILRRHLQLREQDVAVLAAQLRTSQDQVRALQTEVRDGQARNVMLAYENEEQGKRIKGFEQEQASVAARVQEELGQAQLMVKSKIDRAQVLEEQIRAATGELEKIRERVRIDIRKIRTREKELENKLEISKNDSEALLFAREKRIIELKRKLDLLEFNMDLLQDQYSREKESSAELRKKLGRAARAIRVAGGMLDRNGAPIADALGENDLPVKKQAS